MSELRFRCHRSRFASTEGIERVTEIGFERGSGIRMIYRDAELWYSRHVVVLVINVLS